MTLLRQKNLAALFVKREVTGLFNAFAGNRVRLAFLLCQARHGFVDGDIQGRVVFGLPADDQGRARLVNQNRVHLVHDGEIQAPLHAVGHLVDHIVPKVVESELVVGAIGDITTVGLLLLFARGLGQVNAHGQSEEVVEPAHPTRVAAGEVIIHRDHMHALGAQGVQVHRQGCGQRLAFAGAHFRNLAVVQGHAAQHLHIEMAHLHDAFGAFAHDRKRFRQQCVQIFSGGNAVLELLGLCSQGIVRERFELRL